MDKVGATGFRANRVLENGAAHVRVRAVLHQNALLTQRQPNSSQHNPTTKPHQVTAEVKHQMAKQTHTQTHFESLAVTPHLLDPEPH